MLKQKQSKKYCTTVTQYIIITNTKWEAGIKKKYIVVSVIKKLNHCFSKRIKTANYYTVISESCVRNILLYTTKQFVQSSIFDAKN